jgi:hypothetical protein
MFTFNQKLGFGEVQEISNGFVTIYFEDADATKKVPVGFVTIYATEEEAEEASNTSMTAKEVEAILADEKARHINRINNQETIRLMNEQTSRNCAAAL